MTMTDTGFTPSEYQQFTKVERRIITLYRVMKMDDADICRETEIAPKTLRWHLSKIKRKVAAINTKRYEDAAAGEANRQRETNIETAEKKEDMSDAPIERPQSFMPEAFKPNRIPIVSFEPDPAYAPRHVGTEKKFGYI